MGNALLIVAGVAICAIFGIDEKANRKEREADGWTQC